MTVTTDRQIKRKKKKRKRIDLFTTLTYNRALQKKKHLKEEAGDCSLNIVFSEAIEMGKRVARHVGSFKGEMYDF